MKREGIFISYARNDGDTTAAELRQLLTEQEFIVWQDLTNITGEREWWLQITEALDQVAFMLLVLTPGSLASNIVRKEWRYARQQGVCVYLVKGTADLDLGKLPRWMSDQHIYNWFDRQQRDKLLADLNKTPDLKRVPFMAEDLPADFVQRPGEFDQLISLLLGETREDPVAITVALRGAGGYGKTTLAKAICHDESIQDAFDDGILWVTLGETPGDLNVKVLELIEVLCGHKPDYTGAEAVAARFRELLADRDILLVIDDVWNQSHLRPFLSNRDRCVRLITTRNPNTLPDRAAEVKVDAMRQAEAVALLSVGLEQNRDRQDAADFRALAARLGEWPLLLRLANGVLRSRIKSGDALPATISYANRALDKRGLKAFDARNFTERNQAVEATLRVSLDQLTDEDRDRFFELAIFPEDIYVPLATLEKYWRLDDLDTEELCDRLNQFSLLLDFDLGAHVIRLHYVICTFLRGEQKDNLPALNNRLLDGHRPMRGWGELPDNEPYLWDYLAKHLVEAERNEELAVAVRDWRYLAKKILLRKSHSVEKDLLEAEKHATTDESLRFLQILRRWFSGSSHVFNRCQTKHDVESALLARLNHLNDLRAAMQDLAQELKELHLAPIHPLPDLPHPALIRTLEGHLKSVSGCSFSIDGELIASASHDRTLKIWDARTGEMLRTLEGHSDSINECAFRSDGELLISASDDHTLKAWGGITGKMLRTLEGHSASVVDCAFSLDGKLIASASKDKTLKMWDASTGEMLRTFGRHNSSVLGCAFSPDGKFIVSAYDDNKLKVWDASNGEMVRILDEHKSSVLGCAFSPDGNLIASASDDKTIKIWDTTTGQTLRTLEGHSDSVRSCAFSPDGKLIISASDDRTLKVWEVITGKMLRTLRHWSSVLCCAFSPDGKLIISSSSNSTLKIWHTEMDETRRLPEGHSGSVLSCTFSPNGQLLVSASSDKKLKIWNTMTGETLRTLEGHSDRVWGCAFSRDNKLIVSASDDRTLKVWDSLTGKMIRNVVGHTDWIKCCAFSPDNKLIVSASYDRTLKVWDAITFNILHILEGHSDRVRGCAVSFDGESIISASDDQTLKIWNTRTGKIHHTLKGHLASVNGCSFSPDNKLIVSASDDRTLKVWLAETGEMLHTLEGHSDSVLGCSFNFDGRLIVSVSSDWTLRVWNSLTGERLTTFYADGAMLCCAIHGEMIVAGGVHGVYFLELVR